MEYVIFGIVIGALLVLLFIKGSVDEKKRLKRQFEIMKNEYGKLPLNTYEGDELCVIKSYFERKRGPESIDDITAGDLELDEIFKRINYSRSSIGASVLYHILRTPEKSGEKLETLEKKITYFEDNEADRLKIREYYNRLGKLKVSMFDCLDCIESLDRASLFIDYLSILLLVSGLVCICIVPAWGVFMLILAVSVNIISYYSKRGRIEPYIISFGYINHFILMAKNITAIKNDCLKDEYECISENAERLKDFTKHAGLVLNNNSSKIGAGNPFELLLDYVKMLLHVDIIYFYKMLDVMKKNIDAVESLYYNLGLIESYIDIAYFRASLSGKCVPVYGKGLRLEEAYHPLIEEPVKNSVETDGGVLITGSNASGKSTFLKTVALNVLFAQTIHTCTADSYCGEPLTLFSSMALRDNLSGNDSYFMVEIKAMKRILDYMEANPGIRVICFVDEVLRGTNTVERIAASTEILKHLMEKCCIVFAATHDGELTDTLKDRYVNYHFEEEIKDGDVLFNYRLQNGKATTRNAIKLLSVMGFPKELVDSAEGASAKFLDKGVWL